MKRRHGFTLVEVLLALMIFSVVIVAIIEATTLQLRTERMAEDTTRAVMLAQNIIEQVKYQELLEETEESGEYDGNDQGFSWSYRVQDTDVTGLWRVSATVKWSDGKAERDYTAETWVAER